MKVPELAGYGPLRLQATLGELASFRAETADGMPVIVHTHVAELPTPVVRDALHHNDELLRLVSSPGIAAAVELIELPGRAAQVVERLVSPSLADVDLRAMSLLDVLRAALDVVPALAELHVHEVGHGGIDLRSLHFDGVHARLAAPWFAGQPASPAADVGALARVVANALGRGGHRVPQGVAKVLDAATSGDPQTRYRSIVGFARDLARCAEDLQRTGLCSPFPLATDGAALTWRDPTVPCGIDSFVEATVAELGLAARQTPAVVVVEGPSGIGRTTVLAALADACARAGVGVASVRFSASPATPLHAPARLVAGVVADLCDGPPDRRAAVAARLQERLGDDVDIAVNLLPPLVRLVGLQARPPEGSALDKAARVERAARAVVAALLDVVHPFVAVFDDAELADDGSLMALRTLTSVDRALVVVLARRTDGDSRQLMESLAAMRARGTEVITVAVPALGRAALHGIVADGLGMEEGDAAPLAEALWDRGGGNPGVAIADLHALIAAGTIRVEPSTARWTWDRDALGGNTRGAHEVAQRRLQLLPAAQRQVVEAVAVAGEVAMAPLVARALDRTEDSVAGVLDRLAAEQLLSWRTQSAVRFHDDMLRRAALDGMDGAARSQMAVRLGRAALAEYTAVAAGSAAGPAGVSPSDDVRFEVVRLLGGSEHALGPTEAEVYAEWCEEAARVAHRAGAYSAALDLQLRAIAQFGPVGWDANGDRMFELSLRAAENALVVDRTQLVDQLLDTAWAHHPNALQRVRALRLLGNRWWTRQEQSGGLAEMQSLLRELGERFPSRPGVAQVAREYVVTRWAMRHRPADWFLTARPLADEQVVAVLDTLLSGVHLAYTTEPLTHVALVLRGLRITAQHGVSGSSAYFVAGYGLLTCGLGRQLEAGVAYGSAGMALAERHGGAVRTMVCFAVNGFVRHWAEPLHTTIEPMLAEYRDGLQIGRGGYAHSGGTFAVLHSLLSNQPLPRVLDLADTMRAELERLGERAFVQRLDIVRQAAIDLTEGLQGRAPLDGAAFASSAWLASKARRGELALIVHTLRAHVALAYGDYALAAEAVAAAAPHERTAPGEAIVGVHRFQLVLLRQLGHVRGHGRAARRALAFLRRAARANAHDYAHRVALIDAVRSGAFAHAAELAQQHHHLADLALAHRLAHARTAGSSPGPSAPATGAAAALQAWGALGAAAAAHG